MEEEFSKKAEKLAEDATKQEGGTAWDLEMLWKQKERLEKLEKGLEKLTDEKEKERLREEITEIKTNMKLREAMIRKKLGG